MINKGPISGTFCLDSKGATVTLPYDATQDEVDEAANEVMRLGSDRESIAIKWLPFCHFVVEYSCCQ